MKIENILLTRFAQLKNLICIAGCGIANKQKRIVGGQETEVNQYPWMALLTYSNRFYCGASLINDRYVMTAAHCVSGFNKDRIGVTLLEHDRSKPTETELIKRKVRQHRLFLLPF